MKRRHDLHRPGFGIPSFGAGLAWPMLVAAVSWFGAAHQPVRAAETMERSIELYSKYILVTWKSDPQLSQVSPPQIITSIRSDTKVFGGCVDVVSDHLRFEVGGTSYCPVSNTIFVVEDQLRELYETYGPTAIGYALAHEFGHYIQAKYRIQSSTVNLELQADCLAGVILGQNPEATGVRQPEVALIAQTAYRLGSTSHGTGDQRAFAVYSGLGQSKELTCSIEDMAKLAQNQVKDPRFRSISSLRTVAGPELPFAPKGPYLRSVYGSLGL